MTARKRLAVEYGSKWRQPCPILGFFGDEFLGKKTCTSEAETSVSGYISARLLLALTKKYVFWSDLFLKGNPSVLYCASLLRTIFASSGRANERMVERVYIHNIRDFLQAKVDREINARFLWNEQGDLYFVIHNFNEDSVLNNWEKN